MTFVYAALSEERRGAYEAYLSYWDEGTLEDFEERCYFKNLPQWLQCYIDYSAVAFYGVPDGR